MTYKIHGYNKNPHRATSQGKRFNMDYTFVQEATTVEGNTGKLTTSKDGFNYYLLVINKFSCHLWVFLFATKPPSMKTVTIFLTHHGNKTGTQCIQTDQGGKLDKTITFCKCVLNAGYTLETTATGSLYQNAIVERLHHTLADMMRTILGVSNLNSSYWLHAIHYTVY